MQSKEVKGTEETTSGVRGGVVHTVKSWGGEEKKQFEILKE